jgi:hypothetical protein
VKLDPGIWVRECHNLSNSAAKRRLRSEPGAQAPGIVGNWSEPRSGDIGFRADS